MRSPSWTVPSHHPTVWMSDGMLSDAVSGAPMAPVGIKGARTLRAGMTTNDPDVRISETTDVAACDGTGATATTPVRPWAAVFAPVAVGWSVGVAENPFWRATGRRPPGCQNPAISSPDSRKAVVATATAPQYRQRQVGPGDGWTAVSSRTVGLLVAEGRQPTAASAEADQSGAGSRQGDAARQEPGVVSAVVRPAAQVGGDLA